MLILTELNRKNGLIRFNARFGLIMRNLMLWSISNWIGLLKNSSWDRVCSLKACSRSVCHINKHEHVSKLFKVSIHAITRLARLMMYKRFKLLEMARVWLDRSSFEIGSSHKQAKLEQVLNLVKFSKLDQPHAWLVRLVYHPYNWVAKVWLTALIKLEPIYFVLLVVRLESE